jgi:hypothetical protein
MDISFAEVVVAYLGPQSSYTHQVGLHPRSLSSVRSELTLSRRL